MNQPSGGHLIETESDLSWAVNIFDVIRRIRHEDKAKIRTVNLLVEEESRIQIQPQESIPR